jgi:AhpD family alkylhydroperoxidase
MDLHAEPASPYSEAEGEKEMQPRLDIRKAAPNALQAMLGLSNYVQKSSRLEPSLLHLIEMRASQINGCAYCLDMHSKDARANGESEQRLYALNAWRETPFFTDRERAALAWTEAVTLVSEDHVPDAVYEEARERFSEEELFNLTLAIATINSWNRLCISFRAVPGEYQPANASKHAEGGRS